MLKPCLEILHSSMPKLAISMRQEAEDSKLFVVFTDLGYSVELN